MTLIQHIRRDFMLGNLTELRQVAELASVRLTDAEFAEYIELLRRVSADHAKARTVVVHAKSAE